MVNTLPSGSSTFDLSHTHKTTLDMGNLVPIACIPVLPGDKINCSVASFIRGMPTIAPIMDKVDIKINQFFVPHRVIWEGWKEYYTQNNIWRAQGIAKPQIPQASPPMRQNQEYPMNQLGDYLGVSKHWGAIEDNESLSLLPFLAYQKIWQDWFTPQRWVNYLIENNGAMHPLAQHYLKLEEIRKSVEGGLYDLSATGPSGDWNWNFFTTLRRVGWNHDLFTNALPSPEMFGGSQISLVDTEMHPDSGFQIEAGQLIFDSDGSVAQRHNQQILSTVRQLRKSIALEHYLEALNDSGGRYQETQKIMWNVDISDRTLQRSQYIGGDVFSLFTNEVESMAGTAENNLGDLAGKPLAGGKTDNEYFESEEFGTFIVTAHIVPKRSYSDAMSRPLWFTKDVMDLPNPAFEGTGDEAIFNYEVNGLTFSQNDNLSLKPFGYVERFQHYKTAIDRFSGEMRNTMVHWHLGEVANDLQSFDGVSPEFIWCNPRTDIFKVPSEPNKFFGTFSLDIKANRKLSFNPSNGMHRV